MDIEIRRAVPEDYRALHRIFSQPLVYSGTLQLPYASPELWKSRLENGAEENCNLVACVENEIVGSIGIHIIQRVRRRHAGAIGMGVHDKWRFKGIGRKLLDAAIDISDNWYNLRRLELTVFVDNDPAIKMYKSAGFQLEGTLKDYAFRNGDFIDALTMARLKSIDSKPANQSAASN